MLQQTRAEAVIPYYLRFLKRFPDVSALADAPLPEIYKAWEGLGYYSRARNLRAAAELVKERYGGKLPDKLPELRALPGVGEYTAGAIASIAFGLPEPAIDGNQKRVIARLFAIALPVDRPAGKKAIRAAASALLDPARPGDFNQALMGMGALCCLPARPACDTCPAHGQCLALRNGLCAQLPILPEKPAKRIENRLLALVFNEGRVLVRLRSDPGLLAGLWEFPHFLEAKGKGDVLSALEEIGVPSRYRAAGPANEHVFTHLVWKMESGVYAGSGTPAARGYRFVGAQELMRLPMASAMRPFREAARKILEEKP